jgi:arylsulfatase A-like enzyme/Flp pilus assembly protein TadD
MDYGSPVDWAATRSEKDAESNVLLITIDTLRSDRLSCYSPEHSETPHIDALAAKSTLFTRAFAHTSTTLPSHANILLGTTPLYHGVHNNLNFVVRDEYLSLAEHLKQNGYSTAAFVGAFPVHSRFGLSQGFDVYDEDFGENTQKKIIERERPAEAVVDRALEWLDKSISPWFLWIHCYDPHDPYEPPEPFKAKYQTQPYDGEVAYVDFALKKLFRYLEDKGLFANSVIVFTGDHGEGLGDHEESTHGIFAYNSTIWIPLIIHVPGMKPSTVHQNVSHIDVFPTVCDTLKIENPSFLQGESLIPLIRGRKQRKRPIYFESLSLYYAAGWAPIRGIIQDEVKFIDSPIPELFRLDQDFHETQNIAQSKNLGPFRKNLERLIQQNTSKQSENAEKASGQETLEKLKSLGYIGSYPGERKETFGVDDDAKVLTPFYNKAMKAMELYDEGNTEEGISLLKEVITAKKNVATAYMNLSMIYKRQGRLDDAIQVLRLGHESLPDDYSIYSFYLEDLSKAGRWNEIISAFEGRDFKQFEFDPYIWNLLGIAYSNTGDFENALMFCEKAIVIDEKFSAAYSNLGRIYFEIFASSADPQELQEAVQYYQKALDLDHEIGEAHDGIGVIYMYAEDYDKAIHHLETALKLQPRMHHTLYNLGIAYLKQGNKKKALHNFNKFKSSPAFAQLPPQEKSKLEEYIKQCQDFL